MSVFDGVNRRIDPDEDDVEIALQEIVECFEFCVGQSERPLLSKGLSFMVAPAEFESALPP